MDSKSSRPMRGTACLERPTALQQTSRVGTVLQRGLTRRRAPGGSRGGRGNFDTGMKECSVRVCEDDENVRCACSVQRMGRY